MTTFTTAFRYYQHQKENFTKKKKKYLPVFEKLVEQAIVDVLGEDMKVAMECELQYLDDHRIVVTLKGKIEDDELMVINRLKELTGELHQSRNVKKGTILNGFYTSVGKVGFGIFVDCGIYEPEKEILIPLFRLRDQLCKGKKLPIQDIVKLYGIADYLPLEVEVTKIEFDKGGKPKFEGMLSEVILNLYSNIVEDGLDVILTSGISRQSIKRVIAKRGHTQDVVEIGRLGPLETMITCKSGTNAPGIVARIGPFLPDCQFSLVRPARIRKYWR